MPPVEFQAISVVVQGPLYLSEADPRGSRLTQRCLASVRQQLPGATLILSTWEGAEHQGLDYDQLVLNPDPGPTVIKFTRKDQPYPVNINRQVVSTANGLKAVTTPYAIKLRSDNLLTRNDFVCLPQRFERRDPQYSLFRQRVIAANLVAKEYTQGKAIPFFPSDFFHFGLTEDLLALWDLPLWEDYRFRTELSGRRQHANYPFPQLHVEQLLWLAFLNKYRKIELPHKYGEGRQHKVLSDRLLVNNLIILERAHLGLVVPRHLDQNDGLPYTHYNFRRWQYLYRRHCDPTYPFPGAVWYGVWHALVRGWMYATQGVKQSLRLLWAERWKAPRARPPRATGGPGPGSLAASPGACEPPTG